MIDARAAITTKQGKTYRPVNFETLDSYFIDTALDTDTDTFSIVLGDPDHILKPALGRNAEVRCDIFAVDDTRLHALHLGFADEVSIDEENMLTINGRDISSVAVDSAALPGKWQNMPPHRLVAKQAAKLKIGHSLHLAKVKPLKSVVTDGSESYWEFWYRLYRHRKKFMWAEPDGSIWATGLNYNMKPVYHFGVGKEQFWIPVLSLEWRANKQQRIFESYVFGHTGKSANAAGFVAHASVPGIKDWIKKRVSISTVSEIHNKRAAHDEALEELFEAEVGAVEIKLVVAYTGKIIRQNRMATVNLPQVGLKGVFFVVGSKIVGDLDRGLYQEVRLREKKFAISKRVPFDPQLAKDPSESVQAGAEGVAISGARWSSFFIEATNLHHGPWPYPVFLGVLLAICDQETGFRNERRGGHIEWPGTKSGDPPDQGDSGYSTFVRTFANEARRGKVGENYAVGPMQLLSQGYKDWADEIGTNPYGKPHDELLGNRWNPRSNIIAAARALRDKLKQPSAGGERQPTEDFIWTGVGHYGEGQKYADEVKKRYNDTWKAASQEALSQAVQEQDPTATLEAGFYGPVRRPWKDLGGPAAHRARALGNWQSDNAVDLGKPAGSPVFACTDGVISPHGLGFGRSESSISTVFGYRLHLVSSETDNTFFYQHMSKNLQVKPGQHVVRGQIIGYVCNPHDFGSGVPSHVHFAAQHGNPEEMCKKAPDVPVSTGPRGPDPGTGPR
jgi:murein DD-endopeptidase MepM/ murein hydrolase activator NlpD/prophage tail gpP-like protein